MKIGILTYHAAYNFGANLQVLSTVSYLKKKGHDPVVINWIPNDFEQYYNSITQTEQASIHKHFQETYLPLSTRCWDSKDITDLIRKENIEAVLIGSDSVFNIMKAKINWLNLKIIQPTSDHVFPNPFWGDFLNTGINIPIAGLSISSQNADYNNFKKNKEEISKYLHKFNFISVRDSWTKDLVSYFTNGRINPPITPDPVFAFNSNFSQNTSKKTITSKYNLPQDYFLLSFSGGKTGSANSKWLKNFEKYANKYNISCVELPRTAGGQNLNLEYKIKRPLSPIDWYFLIKHSKGYVGALMHPIITAIHNSVPFYSFDHYGIRKFLSTNIDSSKTYHIIKEAGFSDQHFSLSVFRPFPKAKNVVESLINFDILKCNRFAIKQENLYNKNMENIINALNKTEE